MTDPNDPHQRPPQSAMDPADDEPTAPHPPIGADQPGADQPGADQPGADQLSTAPASTSLAGGNIVGLAIIGLLALVLAVSAMMLVRFIAPRDQAHDANPSTDQAPTASPPDVTLGLYYERDGKAQRLNPGTRIAVGDRLMFELSSDQPAEVRLWIEEDGLTIQQLGPISADPSPAMVGAEDGMLAWGFGSPRTITVRASAASSGCPAVSCASQVVMAR
ncbi:MAG: hypothetical protein GXP62_17955 [Oligoflexia bacterium]|nr:hypothetical protein [Oligoflexia bacterium]